MSAPSSPARRFRFPLIAFAVAAAAITIVRLLPELERNLKNWSTAALALLAIITLLLWFLLASGFRWKTRIIGLILVLVAFAAILFSLRVDGTADGTGRPRLVWRWAPKRVLAQPPAIATNGEVQAPPGAKDVPSYFGPNRDGIVHGANLLPDWKSQPPKELWRQAVGSGWSAFAVVGGRAYTQEQRGEEESVTCYELATGRLLWLHSHPGRFEEWQGGPGPRATPTVHEGKVCAVGSTGVLDCLDAISGKELWSRNILKENGSANLTWGVSASPLVYAQTVVVVSGKGGPTLLAYHTDSGEPLWQAGGDAGSYVAPSLVTLLGRQVILNLGHKLLTAHDPETGAELLAFAWAEGIPAKGSQPVIIGDDRVFLSAGYHAGCIMLRISAGADGKLAATPEWESLRLKTQFNSVSFRDGHLYGLDDGRLACLNADTGDRLWKDGRFGSGQSLLVDDLAIVQSETGEVTLCSARPGGYANLGSVPALDSKTWNHPVLAGRYLLVRNDREAVCYELPTMTP